MRKQFFYFATIVAFALTGCGGCSDFSAMFEGKPVTKKMLYKLYLKYLLSISSFISK